MAGITSAANRLLSPVTTTTTTTTRRTAQFSFNSKLSGLKFQCPKNLSKSNSLTSASEVTCAQVHSQRSGQMVSENGNGKLMQTPNYKDMADMAVIGMRAMQKGNFALEYFCSSNFIFHGLDVNSPQTLFKYLPILSFIESYVYQMDLLNEQLTSLDGEKETWDKDSLTAKQMEVFKTDPFGPLAAQLESQGLLTDRIAEQFKLAVEYWDLERKLCAALAEGRKISVADVNRAMKIRSFDFRILNFILYELRGEKVNDLHMELLSYSEYVTEVYDDMTDYEEDVLGNSINVFRLFVGLHGPKEGPAMLSKSIIEAEEKYNSLKKAFDPQLIERYQRVRDEVLAQGEGGQNASAQIPLGKVIIPPVIEDEALYRSNYFKSK